jgi:hypothetical protein
MRPGDGAKFAAAVRRPGAGLVVSGLDTLECVR